MPWTLRDAVVISVADLFLPSCVPVLVKLLFVTVTRICRTRDTGMHVNWVDTEKQGRIKLLKETTCEYSCYDSVTRLQFSVVPP